MESWDSVATCALGSDHGIHGHAVLFTCDPHKPSDGDLHSGVESGALSANVLGYSLLALSSLTFLINKFQFHVDSHRMPRVYTLICSQKRFNCLFRNCQSLKARGRDLVAY